MMAPQNAFAQEVEQPATIVAPQENETGANTNAAPAEKATSDNAALEEEEEEKDAVEAETTQVDEALMEEEAKVEETAMEAPAEEAVEAPAEERAAEAAPAKATSAEAVNTEATAKEAGVETAEAAAAPEEAAPEGAKPAVAAAAQPVITPETGLEVGEERSAGAQMATASNEPNYAEDEKKIQDYDGSNRYKETDLQPGDTNQTLDKNDENVEKDGFKFELKNPAADTPSKTEYGYEIIIDKKTGQRTYAKVEVTDGGQIPVNPGNKPMMGQGDKLTPESPGVTYKPNEDVELAASVRQRNLNYVASEEILKCINSKDNESTSFGFKDNYTTNNPGSKFFGDNFGITYKVNPWPNENDSLELMKLNGEYKEKVFVQGQNFDTGIKVENMDESTKERLVGQVYHPTTGEIVPGARAYIGENGNIHIQMPKGALKKDPTGIKCVVDEDSIFSTDAYKGLQYLDVKFFARPRTAEEFKAIAETGEDEYQKGTYIETGAGTRKIIHDGKEITIDKQGIDRYAHYNLIGNLKLNLDDTRNYTQEFVDGNGEKSL